jgi:alkylation response protein AidB-like acyl-CoA dehydrogenase
MGYSGQLNGVVLQSDVIVPYVAHYGSAQLRADWLPGLLSGDTIAAIAMTEPGAGSDLQGIRTAARRDGDDYVISGSKLFITNGIQADVVVLVARTDPDAESKGISLILVETDRPGFERGRKLDKVGNRSADTAELFLHEVRVPAGNVLGEAGRGFAYLMEQLPQERLSIAVAAQAGAQRAFDETVEYVRARPAFGKAVLDFQNTRFALAGIRASLQAGWAHLDWAIARHVAGQLTAAEASAAKLWHSEMQWQVVDACLQLHGGAGYMNDYPIARLWRDARVQRIYGGTSEIMREVIGRTL